MNEVQLTYREFYIYVIIGGAIIGALLGLFPLFLGRKRNKGRLGLYGFLASIVAGAIAPLIAIVVAAVFSWVIVKGKPAETSNRADAGTNTPADRSSD